MNTEEQLIQYGFSDKETRIYLFLLGRVEAPANAIAKGTGIPRATVYLILDGLKRKGFISSFKKNNVAYFLAESPNRLQKVAQEKLSLTEALIPQLRSLINADQFTPNTKVYMGKEGLKAAFDDIMESIIEKNVRELHAITDTYLINALPKYIPQWIEKREKLGVFTYMIAAAENGRTTFQANALREVRAIPPHMKFDCSINIYGNKIACFSVKGENIHAVIIESPTIVITIKQMFLLVWESTTLPSCI